MPALLLAAGLLVSPQAMGQEASPKPVVMLLLDTSTSMQWAADAPTEGTLPICTSSYSAGTAYQKNRWAIATEVLTGSFYTYWCSYDDRLSPTTREDYNTSPFHVEHHGVPVDDQEQRPDGLLDIYRDSIKFGLMAFDPKPGIGVSDAGAYSYGPDRGVDGMAVNLGARNEDAPWGRLVSPPLDDDLTQIRENNDLIQEQILAARPYAGTPIAPMLEDALYFFAEDERVRPYSDADSSGDPYYDCRSKNIILITDGQPNLGEGAWGYVYSYIAAAALLEQGVTVHVVGYNMPPGTYPVLNLIALAGGSGEAHVASNQSELTTALGEILVTIQGTRPSRVTTVATTRTMNTDDRMYEFNTAYAGTTESPLDEVGHLDQFIYRCDAGCQTEGSNGDAALCEIFSVSDALVTREEERSVQTQLDGVTVTFAIDNTDLTPDLLNIPDSGQLPQLDPLVLEDGQKVFSGILLGNATDSTVRTEYRNQLISLVRADAGSRRENIPFGAVVHSQPVLQANLFTLSSSVPSFNIYRNQEAVRMRPTVLFVGTHDGQMHAFRVDRYAGLPDEQYGEELWAFIPKHLLGQLNRLATGMAYLMDGEPVVAEVRMLRESVNVNVNEEAEQWRSVLLSGYGEGGRGYFALNVTDPENYEFMWELSNTERCYNVPDTGNGCDESTQYQHLGNTVSKPALGVVFLEEDGEVEERAVAVFGGGQPIVGESESGKALFVVDLADGHLLQEFCNSCGNVFDTNSAPANSEFIDCPLTGDVVAYDVSPGGVMTRAFVGDECGQLWRLDMTATDPDDWKLEFFHDGFNFPLHHHKRRPIGLPPALATGYNPGRLEIVYGTGDPATLLTPGERDYVYSVSEYWTGDSIVADVNWELQLENGEIFTTAPLVFDAVAYFGTQTAGEGYCATGNGRLWGIDFDGQTEATNDVVGALDEDGDQATVDPVEYIELENSYLVGLQLVQRPACMYSPLDFEPWLGGGSQGASVPSFGSPYPGEYGTGSNAQFSGSSGGSLELVVQTGQSGVSSPDMEAPQGGGQTTTGSKAVQQVKAPARSIFSTAWGLVFD